MSQPLIYVEVDQHDQDKPAMIQKPTDDELTDLLIEQWSGRYKFLFGACHANTTADWLIQPRTPPRTICAQCS